MIEKLKTINPYDETEIDMDVGSVNLVYENTPLVQKINELIEAVNELTSCVGQLGVEFTNEETKEPVDPYKKQRKWIGKLCKFWDDSDKPENCVYDILCNIFDQTHHEDCPFQCGNGEWYEYCEPVKPDDDIIYKGEQ